MVLASAIAALPLARIAGRRDHDCAVRSCCSAPAVDEVRYQVRPGNRRVNTAVQKADGSIRPRGRNARSFGLVITGVHLTVEVSWGVERGSDTLVAVLDHSVWTFAVRRAGRNVDERLANEAANKV